MIWLLPLPRYRKAKIWLGESPNAGYAPTGFVRHTVSVGRSTDPVMRIAAVELMVPRGPRASYGLLGAELLEDGRTDGEVSVAVNRTGFTMQDSLAVMPDDVRIGLLDEYADAVIAGVARVVNEGWRFQGELLFRWAAHGTVGSSPDMFAELGALVARLLALAAIPSEDELVAMFS